MALLPAVVSIALYLFTVGMTTVSSVIFLYGPGTKLASVAIVHMDEAGTTAAAAAMATLILVSAIAARILSVVCDRILFGRLQRWRHR